jgi:hypothetical protein
VTHTKKVSAAAQNRRKTGSSTLSLLFSFYSLSPLKGERRVEQKRSIINRRRESVQPATIEKRGHYRFGRSISTASRRKNPSRYCDRASRRRSLARPNYSQAHEDRFSMSVPDVYICNLGVPTGRKSAERNIRRWRFRFLKFPESAPFLGGRQRKFSEISEDIGVVEIEIFSPFFWPGSGREWRPVVCLRSRFGG